MSIKINSTLGKFISFFLTYIVLSLLGSFVLWAFINGVLTRLQSIPEITRSGYESPYLDLLGVYFIILFLTILLYVLVIALIPKTFRDTNSKVVIGITTGVLPVTLLYLGTFGFPYSSPADLLHILNLSIAGGLIPMVERKIAGYLER